MPSPPYPIDAEILPQVDPEYVEFYNKYIINQQQVHYQPVEASRTSGVLIPGAGPALEVASTKDYTVTRTTTPGSSFSVRVFTPLGDAPAGGWPAILYMHGGGWVLGNINTENVHCTNWASRAKCVAISVDYRLAPENPFPAAVDDTWEAYKWAVAEAKTLGINSKRIAAGGSSAGGNLAFVLSHEIVAHNKAHPDQALPPLVFTMSTVPVTDNSATAETQPSYGTYRNTCALSAEKMLWYRRHYLPNEADWKDPRASPLFYPDESFAQAPPAFIAVAGLDVLQSEGTAYHNKLVKHGIKSELKRYEGVPHPVMAMNGVLTKGKQLVEDCCTALHAALYA